ncbi:phage tail tape measure protein [Enterococcus italicus]|uniref:phage tail tape measure protein n=1 Tax=Enterococcus italicus TaxID=246144 RepID=UPI002072DCAC|nr:phage tail tape measure protein [Enterococcus italicus]
MAKNIKGITIELDGDTKGLDKAISGISKQSIDVAKELKEVEKLLKFDPGNSELLAQKQQLLAKQIENTSDKLAILKEAQSQVNDQFAKGEINDEQYRSFQREVQATEGILKGYQNQLSKTETEQEGLGTNTKRLETLFQSTGTSLDDYTDILGNKLVSAIKNGTANSDQLETAINKIGKQALGAETDLGAMKASLDKVDDGSSIDNVKQDLDELKVTSSGTDEELSKLGSGITAGNMMQATEIISEAGEKIKEFAGAAQDAFREIDDGMDTFTTVTGKNSEDIKASFDAIYSSMPIESTADLGQALGSLTQQFGFTGDKLTNYGTQLMQFANINNTDVKSSVDNAKSAIETYGLSYDDLGSILDTFTYVSQQTGVTVDDLMSKAVEGAPQIKALGLSFDDGAQMLGQFEQAGVDGSAALSSLAKANVTYAKDGKTLEEGLNGTIDAILGAKTETEALTIASEVFGTKGATRMVDAIQRGTINLGDFGYAAEDAQGKVKETFESTVDPIDKQDVALQNATLAFQNIGAAIAEGLQPILDALIPILQTLGEIFSNMPTGVQTFAVVIGALVVAFTALAPFIAAIITILPVLAGAFTAVVGVISGPVIAVIAAVIAAIIAVIAIIKNWGTIVDWIGNVWGTFSSYISGVWEGIQSSASSIWNSITSAISNAINAASSTVSSVVNGISSTVSGVWNGIKSTTSSVWNGIKSAMISPIESAIGVISGIVERIKGLFNFKLKFPEISIPHIPLPHFRISGSFNPLKGQIPSLGIDWFANGGILTKPTVFGANGGNLMAGGEAGNEAVLPLNDRTLGAIGEGIVNAMAKRTGNSDDNREVIRLLNVIANKSTVIEMDHRLVGELTAKSVKATNDRYENMVRRVNGFR